MNSTFLVLKEGQCLPHVLKAFEPEPFLACSSLGGLHNRRTKNLAASEGVARKRAREARGSYKRSDT